MTTYDEQAELLPEEFDLDPEFSDVEIEEVPDEQPEQGDAQDELLAPRLLVADATQLKLAPRRGNASIAWEMHQKNIGSRQWQGMCLSLTRQAFECPGGVRSASDAWDFSHIKHRTAKGAHAPKAVSFFWKGGSHGFGHVVQTIGGGLCLSNDILINGGVSVVRIDDITRKWGQEPMGWTEDLNGLRIWQKPELPHVDLSNVRRQFFAALEGKKVTSIHGVARVQSALNARYHAGLKVDGLAGEKTLNAYGYHEHQVGISGRPRIPDEMTLRLLGKGRFKVVK